MKTSEQIAQYLELVDYLERKYGPFRGRVAKAVEEYRADALRDLRAARASEDLEAREDALVARLRPEPLSFDLKRMDRLIATIKESGA